MIKKKHKKSKNNMTKPIALIVLLGALFIAIIVAFPKFSADANSANPLKDSKFNVAVQNLYGEPVPTEFPNGKDFIEVTLTASKKDGSPLVNEPILIDKSSSINVVGPTTTEGGQIQLRFNSKKSLADKVQIKLKNCTTIKVSFKIKFSSDVTMRDLSEKNSFVRSAPLTLSAEIKPRMTSHIASAQARYVYTRRINTWGFWVSVRRVVTEQMACNDGVCQATFGGDVTSKDRNKSGSFVYSFIFTDENGKVFSKSFKGKLQNP